MKKSASLLIFFYLVLAASSVFAATATCEVEEVQGDRIILKNCGERAKGFEKGNTVKVKLHKKEGK